MGVDPAGTSAGCLMCGAKLKRSSVRPRSPSRDGRSMTCQNCRVIRERDANAGANILFRTITALVMEYTGRSGSTRGLTLPAVLEMLREAVGHPGLTGRQRITLLNILRLLEGRGAGAEWRLPGAHEPGHQNPAGEELVGGPGVDGAGRNGPGPPNAAKLCVCA